MRWDSLAIYVGLTCLVSGGIALPESARAYKAGDLYATDSIVGNLRYVPATGPAGYRQGSPASEPCRYSIDETQFTHILTKNTAVMQTEVTMKMWSDLAALQKSLPKDPSFYRQGTLMSRPVNLVTWQEAVLFANLLSVQQKLTRCYYTNSTTRTPITSSNYKGGKYFCDFNASGYRLLREGEWEYCCRAGKSSAFSISEPNYKSANCGNQSKPGMYPRLETVAWFLPNGSYQGQAVGTKKANPWNLRDMHGNVFEWCWDKYDIYPGGTVTDYAEAPAKGYSGVVRGGSYARGAESCRSAKRNIDSFDGRYPDVGFRLACTIR